MIKEKQFSFKRFGLMFIKHTVETYRAYLMAVVVLTGILTVVMAVSNYGRPVPMGIDQQLVYFAMSFVTAGTVFTASVFKYLGDKRSAIPAIMLPATTLEKYLVAWIYSFVIFQVIFIIIFYGVLKFVLSTGHWLVQKVEILNIFSNKDGFYYVYVAFTAFHAIAFFGAVYFKKLHFVKTGFTVIIISAVVWILNSQALAWLIKNHIASNPPFAGISFKNSAGNYVNLRMRDVAEPWIVALILLLTVIVWMAAYFKLKEKQV